MVAPASISRVSQELDLIAEVVRREVQRQQNLLIIRNELLRKNASIHDNAKNVTELFKDTKSTVLKKAKRIHAISLEGFTGLVGREIQPERRLGSEMSDYAKKCGVGGISRTDDFPAYDVTARSDRIVGPGQRGVHDCVVIVAAVNEHQASCALNQVIIRAKLAVSDKPVPEETRKMLERAALPICARYLAQHACIPKPMYSR